MYSIIPFIILLISNILLVIQIFGQKRNTAKSDQNEKKAYKSITRSLIVSTTMFIVMTGPYAIAGECYICKVVIKTNY